MPKKQFRSDETISLIEQTPTKRLETVETKLKKPTTKLESKILKKEFVDKESYDQEVTRIEQGEAIIKTKLPEEIYKKPKSPVHFKSEIRLDEIKMLEIKNRATANIEIDIYQKDSYAESVSLIEKEQFIKQAILDKKPAITKSSITQSDSLLTTSQMNGFDDHTISRIEFKSGESKIKLPDTIQQLIKVPHHTKDEFAIVDEKRVSLPKEYTTRTIHKLHHRKDEFALVDEKKAPVQHTLTTIQKPHHTKDEVAIVDEKKIFLPEEHTTKTIQKPILHSKDEVALVDEKKATMPKEHTTKTIHKVHHTKDEFAIVDEKRVSLPVEHKSRTIQKPHHTKDEFALVDEKKAPVQHTLKTIQKPILHSKDEITYDVYRDDQFVRQEHTRYAQITDIKKTKQIYDESASRVQFDKKKAIDQISKTIIPSLISKDVKQPVLKPQDYETISLIEKDRVVSTKILPISKSITDAEKAKKIQTQAITKAKLTHEYYESTSSRIEQQQQQTLVKDIQEIQTPQITTTIKKPITKRVEQQQILAKDLGEIRTPQLTTKKVYQPIEEIKPFKPKKFDETTISLIHQDRIESKKVIPGTIQLPTMTKTTTSTIKKDSQMTIEKIDQLKQQLPVKTTSTTKDSYYTDAKKSASEFISQKVYELKKEEKVLEYSIQQLKPATTIIDRPQKPKAINFEPISTGRKLIYKNKTNNSVQLIFLNFSNRNRIKNKA